MEGKGCNVWKGKGYNVWKGKGSGAGQESLGKGVVGKRGRGEEVGMIEAVLCPTAL